MKISLHEVRQIVRSILRETLCPVCRGPDAYVGLNDVECPNPSCPKFSQEQANAVGVPTPRVDLKSLELDWLAENIDDFEPFCAKHGVTGTVLKQIGPAGGNPLVKIVGSPEALRAAVAEYDAGNGDGDFLLGHMKDA